MPNGRTGGFCITRPQFQQLLEALPKEASIGTSFGADDDSCVSVAQALVLLGQDNEQNVGVEEDYHSLYTAHVGAHARDWICIDETSPLYGAFRECHGEWLRRTNLAIEVARQRKAAIQYAVRSLWTTGGLLVASVGLGLAIWFGQEPIYRDGIHGGLATGVSLAVVLFGGLLIRALFPRPRASCPQCGCDWNIESDNDVQKWLQWQHCPGCGLEMSGHDDSGRKT
jgi:hypothetical protein